MDKNQIESLREHLLNLLSGAWAHMEFDKAVADFPPNLCGTKTQGLPYTAWQLLEHMRIAQWDILEFSRNSKHVSPDWPSGYWPETEAPVSNSGWDDSVSRFKKDLEAMRKLVSSPDTDLFSRIPHGSGQTILREAMLVADHNAYHVGQLVLLRKLLAG
ncbi:MAG: DinB family protein [Acidobacteria bacterium]|nr:MAG: DinB family protein [Acidobacteriota bacterium]